jgi:hypothetical protein
VEGALEVGAGEEHAPAAQASEPQDIGVWLRGRAAQAVGEVPGGERREAGDQDVEEGEEGGAGDLVEVGGEGVDRGGEAALLGGGEVVLAAVAIWRMRARAAEVWRLGVW